MPPCVWINPFSTVMLPGPTCFHPVRSFPLKSCCHGFSFCEYPGMASTAAAARSRKNNLRIGPLLPLHILQDSRESRRGILGWEKFSACGREAPQVGDWRVIVEG